MAREVSISRVLLSVAGLGLLLGFLKDPLRAILGGAGGRLMAAIPDGLAVLAAVLALPAALSQLGKRPWQTHSVWLLLWWLAYPLCFLTQYNKVETAGEAFLTTRYLYFIPLYFFGFWTALS